MESQSRSLIIKGTGYDFHTRTVNKIHVLYACLMFIIHWL